MDHTGIYGPEDGYSPGQPCQLNNFLGAIIFPTSSLSKRLRMGLTKGGQAFFGGLSPGIEATKNLTGLIDQIETIGWSILAGPD